MIRTQENEKSPTQNKKTKDASSDNVKGKCIWKLWRFCCFLIALLCRLKLFYDSNITVVAVADGLAYSALLKNELLGAGIEKIQDPQTEDRRLQSSTPEKRSLFSVWTFWTFSLISHIYHLH